MLPKLISPRLSQIAYEPLGWSTHVKTWELALDIIHRVERPNIGLCLDTFHIVSLLSHSPETVDGLREGGEAALQASLDVRWSLSHLLRKNTNADSAYRPSAPSQDLGRRHLRLPDLGRHLLRPSHPQFQVHGASSRSPLRMEHAWPPLPRRGLLPRRPSLRGHLRDRLPRNHGHGGV